MLGGGAMLAADAAVSCQLALGIEGIIECGHRLRPFVAPAQRKPVPCPESLLLPGFSAPGSNKTCRFYAALLVSTAAVGRPSSIGSEGSRDHSFQEPKYIRTSFTPAFFSARNVFDARAPLKQ